LHDCSDDKQQPRFPNCGLRHENAELRDQLRLRHFHNKHSAHHRGQKLHGEKVELRDDMEFAQIYLIELPMAVKLGRLHNVEQRQNLRPWLHVDSRLKLARDDLTQHLAVRKWRSE
jgi:hypothetical protein